MTNTTSTAAVKPTEIDGVTEDELASLEPEERAALEEKPKEKPEVTPEEKQEVAEVTPEDTKEKPEVTTEEADEKPDDFGVVDTGGSNYRQTVSEVESFTDEDYTAEVEALAKRYEDGEITLSQHTIEAGKINTRKYDADSYDTRSQQAEYDAWQADQRAFFASNKRFETSPVLNAALDGEVRRIAALDDAPKSGAEILAMAARSVLKEMGQLLKPVSDTDEATKRPKAPNKAPTTLSDTPAADTQSTAKNKFASIDALDGMELEAAVSALSASDRKLYESA